MTMTVRKLAMRNTGRFFAHTDCACHTLSLVKLNAQEKEAVLRTLSMLSRDHPARIAFQRGADPMAVLHLIEHDEVTEAVEEIWLAAYHRRLQQGGASGRSASAGNTTA
jgi:hypothetical protein